jgi:hypothetical protein
MTLRWAAVAPPMRLPGAELIITPRVLNTAATPDASVPIRLPATRLLVVVIPAISTPLSVLPEMTFPAPGKVPPTVLLDGPAPSDVSPMRTPSLTLATA